MAIQRVRFTGIGGVPREAVRRTPLQPRARATQQALQDAFVRVLLDVGFGAMTVREVAGVAGVGLGTFYEYQDSKHALAALTIHMRVKSLGTSLGDAAKRLQGRPLRELAQALLDQQIDAIRSDARAWAALFLLERQISSPEAFRKNYRKYVQAWQAALALAGDAPSADRIGVMARTVHVLVYGGISQILLTQGARVDWPLLREELGRAVRGYLSQAG